MVKVTQPEERHRFRKSYGARMSNFSPFSCQMMFCPCTNTIAPFPGPAQLSWERGYKYNVCLHVCERLPNLSMVSPLPVSERRKWPNMSRCVGSWNVARHAAYCG